MSVRTLNRDPLFGCPGNFILPEPDAGATLQSGRRAVTLQPEHPHISDECDLAAHRIQALDGCGFDLAEGSRRVSASLALELIRSPRTRNATADHGVQGTPTERVGHHGRGTTTNREGIQA